MLNRLFRPKWEHSDPAVRRRALESGSVPAEAVTKAALEDSEPEVRRCAVERLQDLELLERLANSDPHPALREAAGVRHAALLGASLQDGPPLQSRLEALQRLHPPAQCALLARAAVLPEVRAAALAWVADRELLCTLAVEDPVAAVRRAALERIDDPQGWETVALNARNRDKQVSRSAQARLDAYRRAESEREAAEQLCLAAERLAESGPANRADMHRLSAQWEQLATDLPPALRERFQAARSRVRDHLEAFEALQARRRGLCGELEGILQHLDAAPPEAVGLSETEQGRLLQLKEAWAALGAGAAKPDALAALFAELLARIEQAAERRARDAQCALKLRAHIDRAASIPEVGARLDEASIEGLARRWRQLEKPQSEEFAAMLQQEFDAALQALRARLKRRLGERRQALDEAERFLGELETALQAGELEHALSLRDRIRHRLKTAQDIDKPRRGRLQASLHAFDPRLDQLRDWRHWGSAQSRERLCSEMEALPDSLLSATDIATRVRNARDAWKRIDRAEGPASAELWARFDQACTRAYAPYRQQREAKLAQLERHLEQKQALCAEIEALESGTDWKQVEWAAVDAQLRGLRKRWRQIGPVPRKAVKTLEQRYCAALERLDGHLEREREREIRRRRALIAQIQSLAEAPQAREAASEVKDAQKQWKPTVQADRHTEQALWQAFREACDAVFDTIGSQRESAQRERDANLAQKQALCGELEALLEAPELDISAALRRFTDAEQRWETIGAVPHKADKALAARFEALQRRFAARQREANAAAAAANLDAIGARARLCRSVEAAALGEPLPAQTRDALLAETAEAWRAPAVLKAAEDAPLRKRLDLATRALGGDREACEAMQAALGANLARWRALCLELELEAGIDSPAQFAQQRLALQAARLEDALAHRRASHTDAGERLHALKLAWHLTGPLPPAEVAALEARFERAVAAHGARAGSRPGTAANAVAGSVERMQSSDADQ